MEIDASQDLDIYDSSLCMENETTKFGEEKPGLPERPDKPEGRTSQKEKTPH